MSAAGSGSLASRLPAISGGIPTSSDFAPSILFTVLYALLIPLLFYRAIQYARPLSLVFSTVRLSLFTGIRIATFIIRAVEAHQAANGLESPEIGPFVAEQVFLGIGFIVLATTLVSLVVAHLKRDDVPRTQEQMGLPQQMGLVERVMQVGLLVAVILGIIAGTQYSSALTSPPTASQTKTERLASSALTLAAMALASLLSLYLFISHPQLPRRSSLYLALTALLTLVIPAYRISTLTGSNASPTLADLVSTKTKVEFWILQVALEWVVLGLLLGVDMRVWFGAGGEEARRHMGGKGQGAAYGNGGGNMGQMEMAGRGREGEGQQWVGPAPAQGEQ